MGNVTNLEDDCHWWLEILRPILRRLSGTRCLDSHEDLEEIEFLVCVRTTKVQGGVVWWRRT
jgi:hypothetical protein